MTWQASEWAWQQDVTGGAKLMLLALAERADLYGVAWIGQAHAAKMTGQSSKTVVENLKRLEQAGLIARFRRARPNGSRTSDWTVLAPHALERGRMEDHPADGRPEDIAEAARRPLPVETTGDDSALLNVKILGGPEPTVEPTVESGSARDAHEAPPIALVWQHYREVFPRKRGTLDLAARRIITAALKVATVEECCRAIDGLAVSEWHVNGKFTGIEYALRGGGRNPVPASTIDRMIAIIDGPGSRGKVSGHRTDESEWDAVAAAKIKADEEQQAREAAAIRARWDAQARGGLSG